MNLPARWIQSAALDCVRCYAASSSAGTQWWSFRTQSDFLRD